MPDKQTVCSLADAIVIDIIPESARELIDRHVDYDEDIRALVKGIKGETLVVTDRGVHIAKQGQHCSFFPYDRIEGADIARVYRRGRFELLLNDVPRRTLPADGDFGPDPAENVVNFPWRKTAMFERAHQIMKMNREVFRLESGALAPDQCGPECQKRVADEISRLQDRLRELEQFTSR